MRFYDQQHEFYCGVDLHTRKMYLCVLDRDGNKRLHRNMRAKPDEFLRAVKPFRDGLVVGVECMFTWYWLADLCLDESLDFILGHALYMLTYRPWPFSSLIGRRPRLLPRREEQGRSNRQREDRPSHAGRNLSTELRLSSRNAGHA